MPVAACNRRHAYLSLHALLAPEQRKPVVTGDASLHLAQAQLAARRGGYVDPSPPSRAPCVNHSGRRRGGVAVVDSQWHCSRAALSLRRGGTRRLFCRCRGSPRDLGQLASARAFPAAPSPPHLSRQSSSSSFLCLRLGTRESEYAGRVLFSCSVV